MFNQKQKKSIVSDLFEVAVFQKKALEYLEKLASGGDSQKIYLEICLYLSTVRNLFLIESTEQEKLSNTVVAFFGMSVGSHAATTFMMQAKPKKIKIADPDYISATNLNRLKFGVKTILKSKVSEVKKELLRLNPASDIEILKSSLHDKMEYFCKKSKTDLIIDAVDDLPSKLKLRQIARELKIPLIMATDVGENIFIDVERHDLKTNTPFFHGAVKNIENIDLLNLDIRKKKQLILKILGFKDHSLRMLYSLNMIGKKISTWPQLGSTASIAGGLTTKAITKIVLEKKIPSGRYYFSTDKVFNEFLTEKEQNEWYVLKNSLNK